MPYNITQPQTIPDNFLFDALHRPPQVVTPPYPVRVQVTHPVDGLPRHSSQIGYDIVAQLAIGQYGYSHSPSVNVPLLVVAKHHYRIGSALLADRLDYFPVKIFDLVHFFADFINKITPRMLYKGSPE